MLLIVTTTRLFLMNIYIYGTYKLEGNDRAGVFLLLVYIYK